MNFVKPKDEELWRISDAIVIYLEYRSMMAKGKLLFGDNLHSMYVHVEDEYNDESYVPRITSIDAKDKDGKELDPSIDGLISHFGVSLHEEEERELRVAEIAAKNAGMSVGDYLETEREEETYDLYAKYIEALDEAYRYGMEVPEYQYSFSVDWVPPLPDLYILVP